MRLTLRATVLSAIAAMVLQQAALAADVSTRTYVLPAHGSLELTLPTSWRDSVRQPEGGLPPTITLRPADGVEFLVMITPLWSPTAAAGFNSADKVKALVESDRRALAGQSVEKELTLRPLGDPAARGFYFQATDKAPQPAEHEYVVRAGLGVGDLLLSATIFSHHKDSEAVTEALKMLKGARQRHSSGAEGP